MDWNAYNIMNDLRFNDVMCVSATLFILVRLRRRLYIYHGKPTK